jgi:hypothetical protein
MKKIIALLSVLFLSVLIIPRFAFAGDCFADPIYDRDFNAEVTTGAFVRDVACMDGSVVVTTLSVGEIVHVIAETDGWYKIERSDGTIGWVGQWLITETSAEFNPPVNEEPPVVNEPLFDIAGHKYEEAIRYVYDNGIVGGYPDGSYKPDQTINRAELLKIIIEASFEDEFESFGNESCFKDVSADLWYTKYVCFAKDKGIIEGYEDGTFKPEQEINFVEALKITTLGFGYKTGYEYVEGEPWYFNIAVQAISYFTVPFDVSSPEQKFTRGQMAEMISRILKKDKNELGDYLGDNLNNIEIVKTLFKDILEIEYSEEIDCPTLGDDWYKYDNEMGISFCFRLI